MAEVQGLPLDLLGSVGWWRVFKAAMTVYSMKLLNTLCSHGKDGIDFLTKYF